MIEKFKNVFVTKEQHSLAEIIRTADEFNKKYVEVMRFIADHYEFIPWIRSDKGTSRFLENEDYRLYDNLAVYRKSTNTCILNHMGLYQVVDDSGVMLRGLDIRTINPDKVDYTFELDKAHFNEWADAVDKLLTAALLTK